MKSTKTSPADSRLSIPIKFLPLLLAVGVWAFIWIQYFNYLLWHFIIVVPAFIFLMAGSFFCIRRRDLRIIPIVVWSGPIALILLFVGTWLVSFPLTEKNNYYIGMDVKTPQGVKTCKTMIAYSDYYPPRLLRQFKVKGPQLKGEALYCDLGAGKNIVALLAFENNMAGVEKLISFANMLRTMRSPSSAHPRIELAGKDIPVLVTFTDPQNPATLVRVEPAQPVAALGNGYRVKNFWAELTSEQYKSANITSHLPWVASNHVLHSRELQNALGKADINGVVFPFSIDW